MICPEVFMHFGFLHSFWTLVCLGLYRCSWIGYDSDFYSLSFSFFSSVGIIHFATISVVHVVMDIFINQGASKLFIDFCCFVLAEVRNSRGGVVLARVCSSCAGVNILASTRGNMKECIK